MSKLIPSGSIDAELILAGDGYWFTRYHYPDGTTIDSDLIGKFTFSLPYTYTIYEQDVEEENVLDKLFEEKVERLRKIKQINNKVKQTR